MCVCVCVWVRVCVCVYECVCNDRNKVLTTGVFQGSVTISETIFNSPGVITVGGQSPRPGESLSTVPSPTFVGEFDNLRVWNRTFDVTQAKQLNYTNVNSTSFSGLVTQWTFSEGESLSHKRNCQ